MILQFFVKVLSIQQFWGLLFEQKQGKLSRNEEILKLEIFFVQ